jgi:hypothetical protein
MLNLVGSVQRRSDLFGRILVYDLGLTPFQRRLAEGAVGVDVRTVPPFVPHWRQGRTWKTWIWMNAEADDLVWLDAGITVLRPLTDFLEQIDDRGYFVVSQGLPQRESIPSDYFDLYGVTPAQADSVAIAAGILGFRRQSAFFDHVIEPTYRDAVRGRSLGFSRDEVDKLNRDLDRLDDVIVRDCPLFRHEQTLLGIHFYQAVPDPHVNDLDRYGGWRSPHDHPEQVIWSHRRRGDYRFLPRIRYRSRAVVPGVAWGLATWARWTALRYSWLLQPSLYVRRVRRALGSASSG